MEDKRAEGGRMEARWKEIDKLGDAEEETRIRQNALVY